MSGIFIAGTDTNVGKTIVTAGLGAYFRHRGIDAGVMKPVESGCMSGAEGSDSVYLKRISQSPDDLDQINTYAFEAPVAPGIAASLQGVEISFDRIAESYRRLELLHSLVLVEGAGGLLVPLGPDRDVVDLIEYLRLPVLLVGRDGLGTVNHTLLSLDYLQRREIPVIGWVLSQTAREPDLSCEYNVATLHDKTSVPFWGKLDFISRLKDRKTVLDRVQQNLGLALERFLKTQGLKVAL